jgi:hypothetical protein
MRPGDGFTITSDRDDFIDMEFTDCSADRSSTLSVSIHRDGIPAVIAELQRLMGERS